MHKILVLPSGASRPAIMQARFWNIYEIIWEKLLSVNKYKINFNSERVFGHFSNNFLFTAVSTVSQASCSCVQNKVSSSTPFVLYGLENAGLGMEISLVRFGFSTGCFLHCLYRQKLSVAMITIRTPHTANRLYRYSFVFTPIQTEAQVVDSVVFCLSE